MTKWYVKDLSKMTGVSVQTLHHYDRIDLLKPSFRLTNGYRLYSEKDLLKLQQIIALKFFGFDLHQIKTLLTGNVDMTYHFSVQAQFLEEKAQSLLDASKTLKSLVSGCSDTKSIPWETILKLIEVYQMTKQLENTWASKVFTPAELKQYANFEAGLKTRYTEEEKTKFTEDWANLVKQISLNLDKDPKSDFGKNMGKQLMTLINGLYGKEHANLKKAIWEKGFKKGHMEGDHFLSPETVTWIDQAIDNYYRDRICTLLNQVENNSSPSLALQWTDLMEEMFGNSESLKEDVIKVAMTDGGVTPAARNWLQQFSKK